MKMGKTINLLLLVIVFCLSGCNKSPDYLIEEVNIQEINKDAQTFVKNIQDSTGLFLFSPVNKDQYLIVKYSSVLQGEEAKFLNSISSEIADRKLIINIEELGTNNYDDNRLRGIRIFKIGRIKEFDKIQIFKNGEERKIDSVGG
ncbi:hypothetical protein [Cohnella terricola]|uniref:Uncharacterized protein n=1 Tax=Cohnella terricola TaxID=1289167 RepID=A0A559J8T4_9BACL|nr:hypothetical protein [Cohnella terricola]TVX96261.1 hypothetical protein FPZ45_21375 [Cohnella terricola]